MTLSVLADAEADLRSAVEYLNDQSPGLGERLLQEVEEAFQSIAERPMSFARLETLPPDEPYRRAILRSFRYAIVFEILDAGILVVAIPHTSREPNYWLRRIPGPRNTTK